MGSSEISKLYPDIVIPNPTFLDPGGIGQCAIGDRVRGYGWIISWQTTYHSNLGMSFYSYTHTLTLVTRAQYIPEQTRSWRIHKLLGGREGDLKAIIC